MAKGSYERLLAWAKQGRTLHIDRVGTAQHWAITVSVADPVVFTAKASAASIDDAAASIIEQLETVGVEIA